MFANCQCGGTDQALPDVCKTPVPVTFTNIALGSTAIPLANSILIENMPAHNLMTVTPITNGDEAGTDGGVISSTFMGPSRHTTGSVTVLIQGSPITRMTSTTLQNSTNAVGARITPSQHILMILAT